MAALACAAALTTLASGCVPRGVAVGDTQATEPAIQHDGVDVSDAIIIYIGSQDSSADKPIVDALQRAGLDTAYMSMEGVDESAGNRAIIDATNRNLSAVMVGPNDVNQWADGLRVAREAGYPVILVDPTAPVTIDETLYAAIFHVTDDASAATIFDASILVIDDHAHDKTIDVRLS
ncbi:sugar ABC transporter substrate-binding protein [Bifidobacterium avesanii]|nr:sugar ABC transporter substrate-binding protein [Bifidobacterium avesanii]